MTTQFRGANASSFMVRMANTMHDKTLKLTTIKEKIFLNNGKGRAKAIVEVSGPSLLADSIMSRSYCALKEHGYGLWP